MDRYSAIGATVRDNVMNITFDLDKIDSEDDGSLEIIFGIPRGRTNKKQYAQKIADVWNNAEDDWWRTENTDSMIAKGGEDI